MSSTSSSVSLLHCRLTSPLSSFQLRSISSQPMELLLLLLRNQTIFTDILQMGGQVLRRMSHHVDPAAIAEEARTVRLDAVLGPPRRSVPVGDSSTPESRALLYSGGGGQALSG